MPACVDLPEPSPPSNVMNLPVSGLWSCIGFAGYSSQPNASTSSESNPRMAKLLWPMSSPA